ncbi:Major Facilitator Superfamily protein [uncultured archaeon]|nr:Major Facilitator Superfamily protein [uncultured archaeon]
MSDTRDENGYTPAERQRSKSASLADGAAWSVMVGAGETFVNPFAIKLGADSGFSGIIQTVPQFIGALAQMLVLPIEPRIRNRRLVYASGVLLQALIWIPIALLAWAAGSGLFGPALADSSSALLPVLGLYILYQVFGQMLNPGWSAWMAELVTPGERGSFFSSRLRLNVLLQMLAVLGAGWMLDHAGLPGTQAFAILFLTALAARLVSGWFLSRMADHRPEQAVPSGPQHASDWRTYLSSPGLAEGRRFSLYVSALITATYIAAPFFDIYMLSVLKFDYFTWSVLVAVQTLAKVFFYTYWGKIIDRFGNRAVLFGTGFLVPAVAMLWVMGHSFEWLFFAQVFSGLAWSGFDLACLTYTISMPDPSSRASQSAVYGLSKGSGMLLGTLLGGALLAVWPHAGALDPTPFLAVFFISAMARYIASAYFLPRFSEHTFEGGMSGGRFLWEVLAAQPSRRMGRHLMDFSEASLHLAQTGTQHTVWAAERLAEVPAAGARMVERETQRTMRLAGEGMERSARTARRIGQSVPRAGSSLMQSGQSAASRLSRSLRLMQDEFEKLARDLKRRRRR